MDSSIDYVQFAKDFHAERWGRGLTQEAIGKQLGISKSTVSRWENANTIISAAKLLAVCFYLDLNPYKYLIVHTSTKVQTRFHTAKDQSLQEVFSDMRIEKIEAPEVVKEKPKSIYLNMEEIVACMNDAAENGVDSRYGLDYGQWAVKYQAMLNLGGGVQASESEQAAENMSYDEWRNAGFGSMGMPTAEDWQNE